jgi:hypothetical protein
MTLVLPAFAAVPVTTGTILLAQPQDGEGGGQGQDFGKSSPVGLLVLLLFLIAVAFLIRSMTKHLKRVPTSFDKDGQAAEAAPGRNGHDAGQDEESSQHGGSAGPTRPARPAKHGRSDGRTANGRT